MKGRLMKKTLLLAVAAVAIATSADAAKLPRSYLGDWCVVGVAADNETGVYRRGSCSGANRITIRARGYGFYEADCRTIKVRGPIKDNKFVATYRCESEEWAGGGNIELMIWREGEDLFVYGPAQP
jgi:hypothetical protein